MRLLEENDIFEEQAMQTDRRSGVSVKLLRALILMISIAATAAWAVDFDRKVDFVIAAQPLSSALVDFSRQAQIQVMSPDTALGQSKVVELNGRYSIRDALGALLKGTDFGYSSAGPHTVAIVQVAEPAVKRDAAANEARPDLRLVQSQEQRGTMDDGEQVAGEKTAAQGENQPQLEEVIVTAQKRSERLQDVPVPVTAIGGETLINSNQLRLQDYYNRIPGLSMVQTGDSGQPVIAIRGLVTGGQSNPTAGIVVDDVPYGATTNPGTLPYAPDIDPGDLARIEVLRGPQGTLYGASSLGGLLKFVTVDPSTDGVSGRVQAGTSSVYNGDRLGYNLRGSLNVPLTDTFAVRASGFTRREPGYVDNIQTGKHGVNETLADGGRLSALWRPSEVFSLKLSALIQDCDRSGGENVDVSLGSGLKVKALPGSNTYQRKSEAYSATIEGKLGDVDLISLTGYNIDQTNIIVDQTLAFGGFFSTMADGLFGVAGVTTLLPMETKKFTQEVRATIPIGQRMRWLFGAFYTAEEFRIKYFLLANNVASGAPVGTLLYINQPTTFDERAAFTNMTFDLTDRFSIQVGGRISENKQTFSTVRTGPGSAIFYQSDPSIVPEVRAKDSSVTYLVTPEFRVSDDLMIYARLASGYRPGGSNANCTSTFPCQYDADTTENYDIGIKGSAFNRALSFDASLYYIDWKDIQLPLSELGSGLPYTANAGGAKSQGVELSLEYKPLQGLTIAGWVAWNDAVLTKAFPANSPVFGFPGDRLPFSSRYSGNLSIDQYFPLTNALTAFVGGSASYVDDRAGGFKAGIQTPQPIYPSYVQIDLRAGVRKNSWTMSAYVNNLADKRGILQGDPLTTNFFYLIRPRTVGASLAYEF